jgi:hypothetical protein
MLVNALNDLKIRVKIVGIEVENGGYPRINNLLSFYLHKINMFKGFSNRSSTFTQYYTSI